jgi:DNA-binding response OmpR family regulator
MTICDPHPESSFVANSSSTATGNHPKPPKILLSILVVDDDDGVRNVLASVLRRASYVVHCADDGEEAWNLLCTNDYDGMITDHEMPRISGLDLVRRVRAMPSNLPVILMSAQMPDGEADFEALISPGMALNKPLSFDKLLAAVCTVFTPDRIEKDIPNGNQADQSLTGICRYAR